MDTQMILRIVALVLGIIGNIALLIAIIGFIKELTKLSSDLRSLERKLFKLRTYVNGLQIDVNDNLYEINNIKYMLDNGMEKPSDAGDTDI